MEKINVLDTNVFLHDPSVLNKFKNQMIIIPLSVIEEIDKFKKSQDENGRNARMVLRQIEKLRKDAGKLGKISDDSGENREIENSGLVLANGGRLLIALNHTQVIKDLDHSVIDNRILSVAYHYNQLYSKKFKVALVTKDAALRLKADAFEVPTEDYDSESDLNPSEDFYRGYSILKVDSKTLDLFIKNNSVDLKKKFNPNEYVILECKGNSKIGRYDSQQKKIVSLINHSVFGVNAKNPEQMMAIDALLNPEIPLVTLTGRAGTGKTLLSIASALDSTLEKSLYNRVLISRPVFPLGKDIGYLPGDLNEKMKPWMQPIFDNLDFLFTGGKKQQKFDHLIDQGLIQIEALAYIRGRSIPRQFFIVDECQNATKHELKTILSRAGEGAKIILIGDPDQIDNPYLDKTSNGLSLVVELFKESELSAHVYLPKGERSALAEAVVNIMK